MHVLVTFQIFA